MQLPEDEFITAPLYIDGRELRFFAPVRPDGFQVAATLMTWVHLKERAFELVEETYAHSHIRLSEDDWYAKAQELYNRTYRELKQSGLAQSVLAVLKEGYFKNHPAGEVEAWLHELSIRKTAHEPQAFSCH